MAATGDIEVYKGGADTIPFIQVTEGTTTPVDISGWTIVLTVKRHATDATALLSIPATITNATVGAYEFPLTHADTVNMTARSYVYDIQRTDAGSEAPLLLGAFRVLPVVLYP